MYCKICQIKFSTKHSFKRHFLSIHEKLVFICKICDMTFHSKQDNTLHQITQHKYIFKCDNCERTFKAKRTLNRHVRLKHSHILKINARTSKTSSTSNSILMTLRIQEKRKTGRSRFLALQILFLNTVHYETPFPVPVKLIFYLVAYYINGRHLAVL